VMGDARRVLGNVYATLDDQTNTQSGKKWSYERCKDSTIPGWATADRIDGARFM